MSLEKKYKIAALVGSLLAIVFLAVFAEHFFACSSGCSALNPEETLEAFEQAVNEKRYEDAQALFSQSGSAAFGDAAGDEVLEAVFSAMYEAYSVECLSSTQFGGRANIVVKVNYMDMRSFAREVYPLIQKRAYEMSFAGSAVDSEEEALALVGEVELELLAAGTEKYISSEVFEISLVREDGVWLIVANDTLYNTLTGYSGQIESVEFVDTAENG